MAALAGAATSACCAAPRSSLFSPSSPRLTSSPSFMLPLRSSGSQRNLLVRATTTTTEETAITTGETTTTSPETTLQTDELLADLKAKWDAIENKTNVFIYGGGALVAIWLSSTVLGAVNTVPLLPKILELVGLGYTGWFVYRYLLFKESRKELARDIEELKSKIAGTNNE